MIVRDVESLTGDTYVFVDVETTGSHARYGQIIEIGIIRVEDGVITDRYETLINPGVSISPFITTITGISNSDVHDKPTFDEVALEIKQLLEGAIFVAHNARFDYGFIKTEFKRLGITFNAKTLCTVKISRQLFPRQKSHSLENIIAAHGLVVTARHRAYADCEALVLFLQSAQQSHTRERIEEVITSALVNYILPDTVDEKVIESLPHQPGVYFFYDAEDRLLYIGKSVDIKSRVRSHFGQSHTTPKERALTSKVAYVEHEVTSGELSALLKESKYIKEMLPEYNRRLRKTSRLVVFKVIDTPAGYKSGTLSYQANDTFSYDETINGVFKTMSAGKARLETLIKEHSLCPKLLGLESGKGACFQFQLGRCKGACIGLEDAAVYNLRFDTAFKKMKLRSWPYKGPVTIPEDEQASEGVAYLVDQWQIKKIINYTPEGHSEEEIELPFDYDTYKILSKHILGSRARN
ncbi:MAG: exonuclease domain-containing protein [Patescibacteria group bacterium]